MSNRKRPLGGSPLKVQPKPVPPVPPVVEEAPAKRTQMEKREPRGARTQVKPFLLHWLEPHKGKTVHLNDMVKDLEIPREVLQSCMSHLLRADVIRATIVSQGNAWVYHGVTAPAELTPNAPEGFNEPERRVPAKGEKRLYEEFGTDKAGRRILKDEDGVLWVAEEL